VSDADAAVRPLGNHRFQVRAGTTVRLAYAIGDGAQTWVFYEGRTFLVHGQASATPADRGAAVDEHLALASPMPATVVDVRISAGDRVSRGDVMIVLEAMKMELPIVAPRDATVTAVQCEPGELVQAGVPLLTLE
jgi:biotin carboxyl carrier protein